MDKKSKSILIRLTEEENDMLKKIRKSKAINISQEIRNHIRELYEKINKK